MSAPEETRIVVQREVSADARTVFAFVTDPRRHAEIDGSDTVRAAVGSHTVTGTGQVFVMEMDQTVIGHPELGEYRTENHVVEFEPDRLITWAPAWPGQQPMGMRWSYALEEVSAGTTTVVHTYDWSRVTDPVVLERVRFPRIPRTAIEATLRRLASAVETA